MKGKKMWKNHPTFLLTVLAVVCVATASCTVHLVSDYDPVTDNQLSDVYQATDALLTHMELLASDPTTLRPACDPDQFAGDYQQIVSRLRLLSVRNAARDHNSITNDQLALLTNNIDTLRKLQRVRYDQTRGNSAGTASNGCLLADELVPIRRTLDQTVTAIMKLELAKRDFRKGE
jgi:hypothetical protein